MYCKCLEALFGIFFFLPLILLKCSHSTLAPSRTLAKHVRISPSEINQDLIVANKVPPGEKCYNIPSLQSIQSFGLTTTVPEAGGGGCCPRCLWAPAMLVNGFKAKQNVLFAGHGLSWLLHSQYLRSVYSAQHCSSVFYTRSCPVI